ncbi:MAG: GNAT family N-acetyltransferase [Lentisphaerae bacterium]|nr:GNAT family N-acetyltransferase [Lentisphaerota bacterium]
MNDDPDNPGKPRVRSATLDDVPSIFELIREHADDLIARSLNDIVQNIDRFYVAEGDGRIVGCAAWSLLPEVGDVSHTSVEIKSVAVRAPWRTRGVGRLLVQAVIDRVLPLNVAQLLVLTFAPEFFAKLGFREIPKTQIMHKIYMGCINCTKHANPFTCPEVAMTLVPSPKRPD